MSSTTTSHLPATNPQEAAALSAMVDDFVVRASEGSSSPSSNDHSPSTSSSLLHVPSPSQKYPSIDPVRERYPFCIVWTPLPLITWILPFIGHMGITDSRGIIHDFAGPYFVSRDNMAFGNPVKYWYIFPEHVVKDLVVAASSSVGGSSSNAQFVSTGGGGEDTGNNKQLADAVRRYDKGIAQTTSHFRKTQFYNFFCNNCHSFVAYCLLAGENLAEEDEDASLDTKNGKQVMKTRHSRRTWNMVTLTAYVFFFGRYVSWGRFLLAHVPFFIFVALIAAVGWGASAAVTKGSRK